MGSDDILSMHQLQILAGSEAASSDETVSPSESINSFTSSQHVEQPGFDVDSAFGDHEDLHSKTPSAATAAEAATDAAAAAAAANAGSQVSTECDAMQQPSKDVDAFRAANSSTPRLEAAAQNSPPAQVLGSAHASSANPQSAFVAAEMDAATNDTSSEYSVEHGVSTAQAAAFFWAREAAVRNSQNNVQVTSVSLSLSTQTLASSRKYSKLCL